jgi:predicted outer membrane lipoprotein
VAVSLRAGVERVPILAGLLAGCAALLEASCRAMDGQLWSFQAREAHRFTAAALLTGTLRLRNGLATMGHDEQVHGGAGYTNWGYGVPLLQAPFHAVKRFFPDRAIFFFYLAVTAVALWAGLDRLVALRHAPGLGRARRLALSWSATLLALCATVYPLMSYRFLVYEETVAYLLLAELVALSAYVFALPAWRTGPVAWIGVASGLGLLVRPTGLVILGAWGLLVALESRRVRAVGAFAAGAAPFVAFWLVSNWVRTGSPFELGMSNSLPFYGYHLPIQRFGDRCADTPAHFVQTAARLFSGMFLQVPDEPQGWMKTCHFDFESRLADHTLYPAEGYLGLHVLVGLGWMLWHHLARGRRSLASLVPFAAMALLFVDYVVACAGFAWRYAADFMPLVAIACVQYVRSLPPAANRWLGWPLAAAFVALGALAYERHVVPARATIETAGPRELASMESAFRRSRWGTDAPMPSRLTCDEPPEGPYLNGAGWAPDCTVDTFTNVYLGLPEKAYGRYALRMEAPGIAAETLRVYVDGRIYTARKDGITYGADLDLHRDAMHSPTVMATVEWTREATPPVGTLAWIEIM